MFLFLLFFVFVEISVENNLQCRTFPAGEFFDKYNVNNCKYFFLKNENYNIRGILIKIFLHTEMYICQRIKFRAAHNTYSNLHHV